MTVGEKIGYYAKQKNISIRRLANECEINYNTLYAIVTRKSSNVSKENIKKIAAVLGIPEKEFETGSPLKDIVPTDAEVKLSATISSIIGLSEGKDKEDKLYLINSFLEANSGLIRDIYDTLKRGGIECTE